MATIGEVAEVVGGSTPSTRVRSYWGGNICWATPTDITGLKSRYISETATKITEEGLKRAGLRLLPPRSILVTSRATVGACAISTVPIATNQGFASLVCKDGIEPEFLYYHISARQRELAQLSAGSTFTELPRRGFRRLSVLLPPLREQRKIADTLSSVDEAIEKTDTVIEQVRRVKQGLAQQLLSRGLPGRHTRFKQTEVGEVPEEWEVVLLGDCGGRDMVQTGPFGAQLPSALFTEKGCPVLNIGNVQAGFLDGAELTYVPEEVCERLRRYQVANGDLLFSRMATVGRVCLVSPEWAGALISYHLIRVRVDPEVVTPLFLMHSLLHSPSVIRQVGGAAAGGTRQGVNTTIIRRLRIPKPALKEQMRIAALLDTMDNRIEAERRSLERLHTAKSALMHVLVTGQVRVRVVSGTGEG
jgi:type I restriction enzyme S subunit